MPPNQRRIAAPDDSLPYELFITNRTDSDCQKSREVKNSTYLNVGILSHVKGSAYIEFGNTKVLSAVLAPREISKQNKKNALGFINCILKCARTGCKNLDAAAITKKEKSLCVAIRKALEPAVCILEFNNFQIDIIVYVLQDDGCVLSSAINCIGAALVDGGVPLYDLITATTVLINNDEISFNPTAQEEHICMQGLSKGHSMTVIATLASQGQIAECFQIGYIPFDLFKKIFTEISDEKKKMLSIVKKVIRKRLEESLKTKA